ncbi:MAG TPA: serine protease [Acidimicrobiia bacterium]|nr:serine protease [Acidimicrobiia bacterium]
MRPIPKVVTVMGLLSLALACSPNGEPAATTTVSTTTSTAATTTTAGLDTRSIYEMLAPSLAYVEGVLGTGSGIVIDDRHVLTNLHVIWPGQRASLSFDNGDTFAEAQVVAVDWIADLALLEVDSELPAAVELAESADVPIGSEVYLIGYPADATVDPTPAITAGVLSRERKWPEADITYLQSDASISGGQSGGALVSETGEVIGISGLAIGEGGLALSLSSPDILVLLGAMNEGRDIWSLGDRLLDDLRGDPATTAMLPNPFAEAVFIFDGGFGDDVMFTIDADKPSAAYLVAPDGFVEFALEDTNEENEIEFELGIDGPHFLSVLPVIDYEVAVEIATETDLIQMVDPDHGRALAIGDTTMGNTDYPGDWDWFEMQLTEGDEVTIRVTSSSTDAGLAIDYFGNTEEEFVASDSDSAGGVLGLDAEVSFTAPVTGNYVISVIDESGSGPGGYIITVKAD